MPTRALGAAGRADGGAGAGARRPGAGGAGPWALTRTPASVARVRGMAGPGLPGGCGGRGPGQGRAPTVGRATAAVGAPQLGAALATSYFVVAYGALVAGSTIRPVGRAVAGALRRTGTMGAVVPLSLLYLAFLIPSWEPGTLQVLLPGSLEAGLQGGFRPQFFPQLSGIVALFSGSELTAGSFWVHILAGILFQALKIFQDGRSRAVPTLHSLLLGFLWAPAGLLAHFLTRATLGKGGGVGEGGDGDGGYVVYRF